MSIVPLTGFGWAAYITDETGAIVPNATITVRDAIFGGLYSGLVDENNAPLTNPFTTGADGYAAFRIIKTGPNWADVTATKGAFSAQFKRIPIGSAQGYNMGPNANDLMVRNDIALEFQVKTFNNLTATTDPTANDDSDDGYVVGSRWVNTASSPMEAFECLDATVANAVWVNTTLTIGELGTLALLDTGTGASQVRTNTQNESLFSTALTNNLTGTADPTATNDSGEGYSVLSVWINQTSSPPEIFQCTDNTLTAAVWRNITADIDNLGTVATFNQGTGGSEIKTNTQNIAAYQDRAVERTVDPNNNDDSDDGFIIGSVWLNTTSSPQAVFIAVDVTVGSAVWKEMTGDAITVFYVDRAQEDKIFQKGWSFWYDTTLEADTAFTPVQSPSGNSNNGDAQSVLTISDIITPNGDSLSNYKILYVEGQIYAGFSDVERSHPSVGNISSTDSRGYGVTAYVRGDTKISFQVGSHGLGAAVGTLEGGNDLTSTVFSNPSRILIVCSK